MFDEHVETRTSMSHGDFNTGSNDSEYQPARKNMWSWLTLEHKFEVGLEIRISNQIVLDVQSNIAVK